MSSQQLAQINDLIGEDQLDEALEQLSNAAMNSYYADEIPQLKAQLTRLQKKKRLNTISQNDLQLGYNKLSLAMGDLLQNLEENTI